MSGTRPNVLFFFADDQRFDTIAALGNPQIRTPHLDALAARGCAFTHAHIPGGTCGAVCMPSRAMLHSGRTLFHIEGSGESIPPAHTTIGEAFRSAGYTSFGTGKWHNGCAAYARSFSCGDNIFFGGMGDHWNVPACHFDPTGAYDNACPFIKNPYHSNKVEYINCDHIEAGRHSTDLFTGTALEFLEKRPAGTPFFAFVSLMAPHDPRTMPERFLKMYDPAAIDLPANFLPEHPIDTGALRIRDELLAAFPRDPAEIRRHIAEYYAMISHLDDALGRLVACLEETGELANTVLVFAGDNGLALGQHGLMGKQNLYDHSVRVPLLFAGPGIPAGIRSSALVYLSDIFPTLCELAGLPKPASVEGGSLVPLMYGRSAGWRDTLYLAYRDTIRGVSDGAFKLIEYAGGQTQLFDLHADPLETASIAAVPAAAGRLEELRGRLKRLAAEWNDPSSLHGRKFWAARPDLA